MFKISVELDISVFHAWIVFACVVMAGDSGEGKKEAWSTEQCQIKGDQDHEFSLPSAHTIGHDSWQQASILDTF
ncbi:hypothetical protein L3X38_029081 [Prunus dulcis]|uniref:Secreted protein n=1 Tax=Prunus dulcis TaxID=3755 RepID=A0AAD4VQY9_PRUDU|nr:hypothetical protein L3X38_029081 [Prunus dulcis]